MEATVIENPVIQDDAIEKQLREASQAADEGKSFELPSAEKSEDRTPDETDADKLTSNPDTTPEKKADERPRDELGRFTKTETGEDIPEDKRVPAEVPKVEQPKAEQPKKEDSAYVRAQKEAERREKSWQQLETEKAQVRAEAERLQQERIQWEQQRVQAQAQQSKNGNAPQHSSEEYAEFATTCAQQARDAAAAGDADEAVKHIHTALEAMKAERVARGFETEQQQTQQGAYYQQVWADDMNRHIQAVPELADPKSEAAQGVLSVMQELPDFFERIPPMRLPDGRVMGGFGFAHEYWKLKKQAGAASGLEQELNKVKAERDDLRQKLQLDGSGPTSQPERKTYANMTDAEIEADLRRRSEGVAIDF